MPKAKKRKPDLRRIRPSKVYQVLEIARCLNRDVTTVRSWIRGGLPTLSSEKPVLILGADLKAWLKQKWAARKQTCLPGELFCFKCRRPRKPLAGSVDIVPRNKKTVTIKGKCIVCGTRMNRAGSLANVEQIRTIFCEPVIQSKSLMECGNPSDKHTLEQPWGEGDGSVEKLGESKARHRRHKAPVSQQLLLPIGDEHGQ